MKATPLIKLIVAVISFIGINHNAIAQQRPGNANVLTVAKKWLKDGEWKNGLKLDVHPSVNAVEFYRQYHNNKVVWDKVFLYLKNTNLDTLSAGKHPIDSAYAYASVTEAPSKELDKAGWESHKKYIDLQYVIKGKEQIGVENISKATVIKPYNESTDAASYIAQGTYYNAGPGTFFLFFPEDVHRRI
jgi:biofilm protein TabA